MSQVTKSILKRLFRVYAHIYHAHFEKVCQLEEERHLNTYDLAIDSAHMLVSVAMTQLFLFDTISY